MSIIKLHQTAPAALSVAREVEHAGGAPVVCDFGVGRLGAEIARVESLILLDNVGVDEHYAHEVLMGSTRPVRAYLGRSAAVLHVI